MDFDGSSGCEVGVGTAVAGEQAYRVFMLADGSGGSNISPSSVGVGLYGITL